MSSHPRRVRSLPGEAVLLALCLLALAAPRTFAARPALPNFHAVGPGVYRGGAPTVAGLQRLKAMGVHTVIDLRISPPQVRREKAEAQRLGLAWVNLPMGSDPPTAAQVSTFLSTLRRAPQEPVFVHCEHGCDRTGCMMGIWRETEQGWTFPQAWAEMRKYGFDPRWTRLTQAVRQRASQE